MTENLGLGMMFFGFMRQYASIVSGPMVAAQSTNSNNPSNNNNKQTNKQYSTLSKNPQITIETPLGFATDSFIHCTRTLSPLSVLQNERSPTNDYRITAGGIVVPTVQFPFRRDPCRPAHEQISFEQCDEAIAPVNQASWKRILQRKGWHQGGTCYQQGKIHS